MSPALRPRAKAVIERRLGRPTYFLKSLPEREEAAGTHSGDISIDAGGSRFGELILS